MGKGLERGSLNIPQPTELPNTNCVAPYVIVGDEAFPLKTNLLRPYPSGQHRNDVEKKIFNYRLSRARRCSENAFGILGQKFQLYNRRLKSAPQYADKIVLTTCILHNFIRESNIYPSQSDCNQQSTQSTLLNIPRQGGNAEVAAFEVRDLFKRFFNSDAGSVERQMDMV